MEYFLKSRDNVFPCEVTIDEDNGRYMIRKSDSSGEVFNSPSELVSWIMENWEADDFLNKEEFLRMLEEIKEFIPIIR